MPNSLSQTIRVGVDLGGTKVERGIGYEHRLARSLAQVINILDPDVIVLGACVSNVQCSYHNVPKLLAQFVFSDQVTTPIVRNFHGDFSGVRGAAWLTVD